MNFYRSYFHDTTFTMDETGKALVDSSRSHQQEKNDHIQLRLEAELLAFSDQLKPWLKKKDLQTRIKEVSYFTPSSAFKGSLWSFPSCSYHYGDVNLGKTMKASYFLTVGPSTDKLPNTSTQYHPIAVAQLHSGIMSDVFVAVLWIFREHKLYRHYYGAGDRNAIGQKMEAIFRRHGYQVPNASIGDVLQHLLLDLDTFSEDRVLTEKLLEDFYSSDLGESYYMFATDIAEIFGLEYGDKLFE